MITKIFYSLVFFPFIQYEKPLDGFDYILESTTEKENWIIGCTFRSKEWMRHEILFYHIDSKVHSLFLLKNWVLTWVNLHLLHSLTELLKNTDTQDFHFFKNKDFYKKIPFGVVLTITSKCNLFCNYCFNDYDYPLEWRNHRENIWFEKYKDIVDKLHIAGTRDIIITGWEPFSAPFFWELLAYIRDKWIFIRINTNGTLLFDKTLERLNNEFSLNLMVSMHEFNNKDYFDVNELWAKNFGWIEELKWFENKFDTKVIQLKKIILYKNLSLDFLTILRPKNIIYLEELYRFVLSNFKIEDWHFFRLYSTGTTKGISRSLIKIAIYKLFRLNKKYGTSFKFVDSVPFCAVQDLDIASEVIDGELSENHNVKTIITTDGNIQIMSAFDSNLGSIFDNNILDVWNGDFVQKMLNNDFLPKECWDCKYREKCRWWSRMDAHIFNEWYDAFDPLWDIANKIIA